MLDAPPATAAPDLADIQQSFTEALPRIEGLASAYLRMKNSERKDEAIQEVVALSWKAYRDLVAQGRDVEKLLGRIVEFAAKQVRSGRRLGGAQPIRDIMSATCRFREEYRINSLPIGREDAAPEINDALRYEDSPADQAVVNVDFQAWLDTLDGRQREIAEQLASGYNTVEVGRLQGVSRARIHQLRLILLEEWRRFNARQA